MNIPEAIKHHQTMTHELVGKVFPTNSCGDVIVESYQNCNNITICFVNSGFRKRTRMDKLRSGAIRDNSRKIIKYNGEEFIGCGVGLPYEQNRHAYYQWRSIMMRCYKKKRDNFCSAYDGCTMSKEWHDFKNFVLWYDRHKKTDKCCVDKDLLVKGNKVYCAERCCLVPIQINNAIIKQKSRRGDYPIGVRWSKAHKKFGASIALFGRCKNLGWYNSVTEAFEAYKERKEAYLKELAGIYREEITHDVYQTLINYQVEITD